MSNPGRDAPPTAVAGGTARRSHHRFCGRPPDPGHQPAPGPAGPICPTCILAGLRLIGLSTPDDDRPDLTVLVPGSTRPCKFCHERRRRGVGAAHHSEWRSYRAR
ncbi:MAG: hypothetical protein ACREQ5_35095 [Candidatus Dormibacteria bacterium]